MQYLSEENKRRSEVGCDHIATFTHEHYFSPEDREDVHMAASDLIADILHYVRERGEDPAGVMSRAWTGYIGDYEDEPPGGATPPTEIFLPVLTHTDPGDEHVERPPEPGEYGYEEPALHRD